MAMVFKRHQDAVGKRSAASRHQALDGRQRFLMVVGGGLNGEPAIAEGHHTDRNTRRLVVHELAGRRLGCLHAGRLQVIRRHAARDIKGQDHRPFHARQTDRRLRPGCREDQDRDAAQKKQHWNVS